MKLAIHNYGTPMGVMHTARYADEVSFGRGVIDVVRFDDYKEKDTSYCSEGKCKVVGQIFPNKKCIGCVYKVSEYIVGVLITCYECKITLQDFKSKNGHNFYGNHNYYVVPKELVNQIINLVPKEIGIIQFSKGRLKKIKECQFKKIEDSQKITLLYNAFKKWCGNYECAKEYNKQLRENKKDDD
jgi:hypothetical protein